MHQPTNRIVHIMAFVALALARTRNISVGVKTDVLHMVGLGVAFSEGATCCSEVDSLLMVLCVTGSIPPAGPILQLLYLKTVCMRERVRDRES